MTHHAHILRRIEVRQQILTCNACDLGSANRVPWSGSTFSPDLILLGEAPGANEDREGRPFVGRAGKLLDSLLEEAGTSRSQVTVTNTVCCRPPRNRDPSPQEVQACHPNLKAQLSLSRTPVGIVLGRVALGTLRGDHSVRLAPSLNVPFEIYDKLWFPTYHPAYALRNPSASRVILGSIETALSWRAQWSVIDLLKKELGAEIIG
jgi:DNA polymerase